MLVKDGNDERYLDFSSLELNRKYINKICYVVDIKSGMTRLESGFFAFYIKDINANIIQASLFNTKEFLEAGVSAQYMKRKAVKIDFYTQEFRGALSIVMSNIEPYNGQDFDYTKFIGRLENAEQVYKTCLNIFTAYVPDAKLPAIYVSQPISSIYSGRCGGYLLLVEQVLHTIVGYKNVDKIKYKELISTFYHVQNFYFKYFLKLEELDIITPRILFDFMNAVNNVSKSEVVLDCMMALLNLDKPRHIYSNIIVQSIRSTERLFNLIDNNAIMPIGMTKKVGEDTLVKY